MTESSRTNTFFEAAYSGSAGLTDLQPKKNSDEARIIDKIAEQIRIEFFSQS
jgi:hypothetical protein